jgi:predicted  nucleic acid-binding Zn-ribbon protein
MKNDLQGKLKSLLQELPETDIEGILACNVPMLERFESIAIRLTSAITVNSEILFDAAADDLRRFHGQIKHNRVDKDAVAREHKKNIESSIAKITGEIRELEAKIKIVEIQPLSRAKLNMALDPLQTKLRIRKRWLENEQKQLQELTGDVPPSAA